MFTGIVQGISKLESIEQTENGLRLTIEASLPSENFGIGNSIAVNGVCLTVENYDAERETFSCTAVPETLNRSTFAELKKGDALNLEASITMSTPLAGHFVLGHVDCTGLVFQAGSSFIVELPKEYLKFCPVKGSITIHGVSLTIAAQEGSNVELALIPETLEKTVLGRLEKGARVNVEVDTLARYLDKLHRS